MNLGFSRFNKRHSSTNKGSTSLIAFLDKCVFGVALIGPIMTILQILTIWIGKQTSGVSVTFWMAYFFISLFWVLYGIAHKEKIIISVNAIWVILNGLIIIGLLR